MKCKAKGCALEIRHKGRCSPVGPYVANDVANRKGVANGDVHGDVVRGVQASPGGLVAAVSPEATRVEKWRDENRDRYNARMREYMRKRRGGVSGKVTVEKGPIG
jgi:hypothetical protein